MYSLSSRPRSTGARRPRPWRTRTVAAAVCLCAPLGVAAQPNVEGDYFASLRKAMVDEQIRGRGIEEPRLLNALETVPRHEFVPEGLRDEAYRDEPLQIGSGQTVSQPYLVALMADLLELDGDEKLLEIGTGSGYTTAVLARLARRVYTIEIIDDLAERARTVLGELGYGNVEVRVGDGYRGWPEEAPFDGILLSAAPSEVPPPLLEQLKVNGVLVAPVGRTLQDLVVIRKTADGLVRRQVDVVRLVPMVGRAQEDPEGENPNF